MNAQLRRAWLALHYLPRLKRKRVLQLLQHFPSPIELLAAPVTELRSYGAPADFTAALSALGCQTSTLNQTLDTAEAQLDQLGVQLIDRQHADYPALLLEISDPPLLLYVRGDASLLNRPQLAVVGSRHCSRSGADSARDFAQQLSTAGMSITSGLALGIDAEAHRGALLAGESAVSNTAYPPGGTIAVLGCGIDVVYPRRNQALYDEIAHSGVLVSEFALGAPPHPAQFPRRNRIISGMSLGVLVVEAALRSGSLITARMALEQNREVFALPGSIHSPTSAGCNRLLRDGAQLVTCVEDIIEGLPHWPVDGRIPTGASVAAEAPLNAILEGSALLEWIGFEPTSVDALIQRSGLSIAELQTQLVDLEMAGVLEQRGGCWQRRM